MTTTSSVNVARFEAEGFAPVPGVLSSSECAALAARVHLAEPGAGGTRCLLSQPWCDALAHTLRAHSGVGSLIPAGHVAVQCNYFEKSSDRNWLVPIHQDLSIPVAARVDEPALRGWSEKERTLFVRAPDDVSAQLVAVRIHLDPCGLDDGPLRVLPGSHKQGAISAEEAVAMRDSGVETVCLAEAGDALLMRPLLLHASSKGTGASRRRVLHMVFGPRELPYGLRWSHAAG